VKGYLVVDDNLVTAIAEKNQWSEWYGTLWPIDCVAGKPAVFTSVRAARAAIRLTQMINKRRKYPDQVWHILKFVEKTK